MVDIWMKSTWNSKAESLNRMRSSGILNRLENIWIENQESNINAKSWNEITMKHIQGILQVYSVMVLLSLVSLVGEILWMRYSEKRDLSRIPIFQYLE
ncbi:hypothetical protein JTB14_019379 [Gonioctena quinquepunctata]|nr:hypothetical protein JTB14_019379 [Gonioctena quinquepunctata]